MKKRIFSVLLVVAMLASMVVMPVYADSAARSSGFSDWAKVTCPCGCGKTVKEVLADDTAWTEWTQEGEIPKEGENGHYYISAAMSRINAFKANANILLDIRGNTLDRSNATGQILNVVGGMKLCVIDSVGGGLISGGSNMVQIDANASFEAYNCKFMYESTGLSSTANHSLISCSTAGVVTVKMQGCKLDASKAQVLRGGAVLGYKSDVTLIDCDVIGGTVKAQGKTSKGAGGGGGVYVNAGKLTVKGGSITGGNAEKGGAIYVEDAGTLVIDGCDIENKILIDKVEAITSLSGKPTIENLDLSVGAKVDVSGLTGGTIKVTAEKGVAFTAPLSSQTEAQAKVAYFKDAKDTLAPNVAADNSLVLSEVGVYVVAGETQTWYTDLAAAQNATGDYIKVMGKLSMELVKDGVVIDANGYDFTVTGADTITAKIFDSSNDDYKGFGNVKVTGVKVANSAVVNGKTYVAVKDAAKGTYSFHRLDMKISSVALRTLENGGGMYYYVTYNCDSTLKGAVENFGIKYDVYDAAGETKVSTETKKGEEAGDKFVVGAEVALGGVFGVMEEMKATSEPALTGKMKISGTPFIKVNGEEIDGAAVKKSLLDLCKQVDGLIAAGTKAEEYTGYLNSLLNETWKAYDLTAWNTDLTKVQVVRGA